MNKLITESKNSQRLINKEINRFLAHNNNDTESKLVKHTRFAEAVWQDNINGYSYSYYKSDHYDYGWYELYMVPVNKRTWTYIAVRAGHTDGRHKRTAIATIGRFQHTQKVKYYSLGLHRLATDTDYVIFPYYHDSGYILQHSTEGNERLYTYQIIPNWIISLTYTYIDNTNDIWEAKTTTLEPNDGVIHILTDTPRSDYFDTLIPVDRQYIDAKQWTIQSLEDKSGHEYHVIDTNPLEEDSTKREAYLEGNFTLRELEVNRGNEYTIFHPITHTDYKQHRVEYLSPHNMYNITVNISTEMGITMSMFITSVTNVVKSYVCSKNESFN